MSIKSLFLVWDFRLTNTAFAWVQILQRVCFPKPWDTDVHTWWGRGGMCGPIVDEPSHTHKTPVELDHDDDVLHQWLTRCIQNLILLPKAMVHFLFFYLPLHFHLVDYACYLLPFTILLLGQQKWSFKGNVSNASFPGRNKSMVTK